jgi:methylthioribose-1-phosphate isomerase
MLQNRQQHVRTVWWEEDTQGPCIRLLDQARLPLQTVFLCLRHEQEVAEAIVTLKVRGAPVIGVTAAFGLALALTRFQHEAARELTIAALLQHLEESRSLLQQTRPTAVNLFWALERMQQRAKQAASHALSPQELVALLQAEAQKIADEDVAACRSMGEYGAQLIADGDTLLTHCNAGALATAGLGTALAPIYIAHYSGKHLHIYVDETRPVLQGARLTAWELQQQGVPLTLITDNMAGHFMRHGGIRAVFVGADRIAANGDVANKIGTYSLAVLAQAHSLPFYVVAPCSSIDLSLSSGDLIPIEQRQPEEITHVQGVRIAPPGVQVANPAFDVTPASYISAIVTEKGIARAAYRESLHQLCMK